MDFLKQIIKLTGLPEKALERELDKIIQSLGFDPDNLSSENIREILATYMQDTLIKAKEEFKN